MPELPEVETVCRGLHQTLAGKTIAELHLLREDMRIPFPSDLPEIVEGRTVTAVYRRAKYILIKLDSEAMLIAHLGMSGQLLFYTSPTPPGKHVHAAFYFTDGAQLIFKDPRRFGLLTWTATQTLDEHPFFAHLGPDPLEARCTVDYLLETMKGRILPLKSALMDQHILTGVGNIYACEGLFRVKLSPWLPAGKLTRSQAVTLLEAIRTVLGEAIESGGSTLRDYVRSSGDVGYFQHRFTVYGREKKPCFTCETPIAREVQAGRSTFFCPTCQSVEKAQMIRTAKVNAT